MYSRDELFLGSLECYFGIYFPRCFATREINTKITLLMPTSGTTRLIYYFVIRHRKKGKHMYVFVFALCTGISLNLTYCFYAYLTYVLCVIMRNHGIKFAAVLLLLTLCTFGLHHEKVLFVLVSANRDDIWENIQLLCIGQNIMQFKLCKIWRHLGSVLM